MADQFGGRPTAVLSDESQRTSGRDALSMNITAGSAVAEAVRTTLGPQGMDKMLVSDAGDVVVTNDGVTVLSEMDVDHPAADMIIDVAETQEREIGDGTTTAVVIAGALLDEASDLTEDGVHPSTIVSGYRQAADAVPDLLDDVTIEVAPDDTELLEGIARTAMTGKGAEGAVDHLAPLVVDAVRHTVQDGIPDPDAIKVHAFSGQGISDSRLIDGMMVDRFPDHANMSESRDDVDLLVYDGELGLTESDAGVELEVGSMADLDAFVEREREELDAIVEGIIEADVDAVFTTGGVDDGIQQRFGSAGVLSVSSLRDADVEKLVAATGASLVTDLTTLSGDDLGYAGRIRQELIRGKYGSKSAEAERSLVLEDVGGGDAITLLLRGSTEHVVEELERAIDDAIGVVAETLEDGRVVPGGGASEVTVALGLRDRAAGAGGREGLAIEAVADALETIPRTLATNGGLDSVDAIVDLRASHDAGDHTTGIDVATGEVVDMQAADVVEPRGVKTQALTTGIETVTSLLRIDDVVSAGDLTVEDGEEEEDTGLNPYS